MELRFRAKNKQAPATLLELQARASNKQPPLNYYHFWSFSPELQTNKQHCIINTFGTSVQSYNQTNIIIIINTFGASAQLLSSALQVSFQLNSAQLNAFGAQLSSSAQLLSSTLKLSSPAQLLSSAPQLSSSAHLLSSSAQFLRSAPQLNSPAQLSSLAPSQLLARGAGLIPGTTSSALQPSSPAWPHPSFSLAAWREDAEKADDDRGRRAGFTRPTGAALTAGTSGTSGTGCSGIN